MSESRVIIQQETVHYFQERQRLRQEFNNAHRQVQILEQFSNRIPIGNNTAQLPPQTSEATPPAELQVVLPELEKSIGRANQIEAFIREQYAAINQLESQARARRNGLILCGVVLGIILLLLLLHAVHVF